MKTGIYMWTAEVEGTLATGWLKDQAGRTVARGTGDSVRAAQQNALETTTDEGARAYLRQILFPDAPTK